MTVSLGLPETEALALGEGVDDSDPVALPDCDAEPEPVGVPEGVPEELGEPLQDCVAVSEGEVVGLGVDDSDGVDDAVALGVLACKGGIHSVMMHEKPGEQRGIAPAWA